MKILTVPDPALTTICREVQCFINNKLDTYDFKHKATEMLKLMKDNKGIGLAAPQVGILQRFFVMRPGTLDWVVINPVIVRSTNIKPDETLTEGCLSNPGFRTKVTRPWEIEVEFFDENWKQHKKTVNGTFARVFQHELDHLNGINIS